jgi:hypothetical protein
LPANDNRLPRRQLLTRLAAAFLALALAGALVALRLG